MTTMMSSENEKENRNKQEINGVLYKRVRCNAKAVNEKCVHLITVMFVRAKNSFQTCVCAQRKNYIKLNM